MFQCAHQVGRIAILWLSFCHRLSLCHYGDWSCCCTLQSGLQLAERCNRRCCRHLLEERADASLFAAGHLPRLRWARCGGWNVILELLLCTAPTDHSWSVGAMITPISVSQISPSNCLFLGSWARLPKKVTFVGGGWVVRVLLCKVTIVFGGIAPHQLRGLKQGPCMAMENF